MERSGLGFEKRRASNARALKAFGATSVGSERTRLVRHVREGNGVRIFTIGYERRSGEELATKLQDAGVACLIDVRDKPVSRKADFRASALRIFCEDVGVRYEHWSELGSTESQRRRLRETGDLTTFRSRFRAFVKRGRGSVLDRLASLAKRETIALLCYERVHEECHRSIIADLLAERTGATVLAVS